MKQMSKIKNNLKMEHIVKNLSQQDNQVLEK